MYLFKRDRKLRLIGIQSLRFKLTIKCFQPWLTHKTKMKIIKLENISSKSFELYQDSYIRIEFDRITFSGQIELVIDDSDLHYFERKEFV